LPHKSAEEEERQSKEEKTAKIQALRYEGRKLNPGVGGKNAGDTAVGEKGIKDLKEKKGRPPASKRHD